MNNTNNSIRKVSEPCIKGELTNNLKDPFHDISWWETKYVKLANLGLFLWLGIRHYKSFWKSIRAISLYEKNRKMYQGDYPILKYAKVNKRYFRDISMPGYPSKAINKQYEIILNRLNPIGIEDGLAVLYFSITNKCGYKCKHCYEWDMINTPDSLTTDNIIHIVNQFQKDGVGTIFYEGGEPMQRFKDLIKIVENTSACSDCWIITSGHLLTQEKAHQLYKAGLTGIMISLDHYNSDKNNSFRGHPDAYSNAINAIHYAKNAKLVTALSLCSTKEFTTRENILIYLDMARRHGVTYVQILEPRPEGKFRNQDISLNNIQLNLLDDIYFNINSKSAFKDYPIIIWPSFHQRRNGCYGAGQRYLYIDSSGMAHSCPFCKVSLGNALNLKPQIIRKKGRERKCQRFNMGDQYYFKEEKQYV